MKPSIEKMNGLSNGLSVAATLLLVIISTACSRKAAEVAPPPPEVLVATVVPRDVPVLHEGVATLEGFITANINAQVQGYLISRDYKEGSVVKKGDLLFQNRSSPISSKPGSGEGKPGCRAIEPD